MRKRKRMRVAKEKNNQEETTNSQHLHESRRRANDHGCSRVVGASYPVSVAYKGLFVLNGADGGGRKSSRSSFLRHAFLAYPGDRVAL